MKDDEDRGVEDRKKLALLKQREIDEKNKQLEKDKDELNKNKEKTSQKDQDVSKKEQENKKKKSLNSPSLIENTESADAEGSNDETPKISE